jgi:hypothetical protein
VPATQRLIGNWAEGGLLNGLTLEQTVGVLRVLDSEISTRLHQSRKHRANRPTDHAFRRFCLDVLIAMADDGEEVRISRTGSTARILKLLLQAADQRVPRDLFKHLQRAARSVPAEKRHRRVEETAWAKFIKQKTQRVQ